MSNVVQFPAGRHSPVVIDHVLLWEGVVLGAPLFAVDLVEPDGGFLSFGCWPTYRQARAHAEDVAREYALPVREDRL